LAIKRHHRPGWSQRWLHRLGDLQGRQGADWASPRTAPTAGGLAASSSAKAGLVVMRSSDFAQQARSNLSARPHTSHHESALMLGGKGLLRKVLWWALRWGSLDGMQGVRGSNPLSSTTGQRPDSASAVPGSPAPGSRLAATAVAQADPSPTRASHRRCWPASSRGLTFQMRSPGAGKRSGGSKSPPPGRGGRPRSDVVRISTDQRLGQGLARVQSAGPRLRCSLPGQDRIGRHGMAEHPRLG
jgi:hypothetical protein